jgi:ATP-binding cassette subfamily A (ABC1) protein 3
MKLMGLSNWLHWSAWFTKYFIFMFIIVVLATVCLFANNGGASAINYSNWFLVFVFILLYTTATIFFCFAVSVFFSKGSY